MQGGLAGAGGSPGEGAACGGCRTRREPLTRQRPCIPRGGGCCKDAAAWPGRRWGCQRLSLPIHHRCRLDHITDSSQVGPALSAPPGGCGEVVPDGLSG